MRQRCALARCIANDPEVMLMDEPLAAIDALTRLDLQDELLRIWSEASRERARTVLYITHAIDEAIYLSDRVVVMSASARAGPPRNPRAVRPAPRSGSAHPRRVPPAVRRDLAAVATIRTFHRRRRHDEPQDAVNDDGRSAALLALVPLCRRHRRR